MRIILIGILAATVVAGAIVTLVNTVSPIQATTPQVVPQESRRVAAFEARLTQIEARLAEIVSHLRPTPQDERPLPDGVASRPAFEGTPSVGQHLADLEGSLFDFEREIRRDLRNLYDALRRRLDQIESKGLPVRSVADSRAARPDLIKRVRTEGIIYEPELEQISFEAVMATPTRALEFIAVAPGGRAHESLLVVNAGPMALSQAIADLGLKEALDADFEQDLPPRGDGLVVYATWDGKKHPVRIETLLKDGRNGTGLPRGKFAFTASRTFLDTKTFEDHLAADVYHHVIALSWKYNMDAVLACSLKEARDENTWIPDSASCPEPGTSMRVILRKEVVPEWELRD